MRLHMHSSAALQIQQLLDLRWGKISGKPFTVPSSTSHKLYDLLASAAGLAERQQSLRF